jgi:hypothetical protein
MLDQRWRLQRNLPNGSMNLEFMFIVAYLKIPVLVSILFDCTKDICHNLFNVKNATWEDFCPIELALDSFLRPENMTCS